VDISASKKIKADLTQESFDRLLDWLDRDRDRAGDRYEEIRSQLIKIFVCRGCTTAEELADETINRVAKKLHEILDNYVGDPALYFYGVAQMVHLEYLRKNTAPPPHTLSAADQEAELKYACLEECMERLSDRNRELILLYYGEDRQAKIDRRKELAERLGIGTNALWIRAHRIRESLRECVSQCLKRRQSH
jgi:DNA-directed RNA polymerase specialized sigma24 family protein